MNIITTFILIFLAVCGILLFIIVKKNKDTKTQDNELSEEDILILIEKRTEVLNTEVKNMMDNFSSKDISLDEMEEIGEKIALIYDNDPLLKDLFEKYYKLSGIKMKYVDGILQSNVDKILENNKKM
jgi:hypothetical protein